MTYNAMQLITFINFYNLIASACMLLILNSATNHLAININERDHHGSEELPQRFLLGEGLVQPSSISIRLRRITSFSTASSSRSAGGPQDNSFSLPPCCCCYQWKCNHTLNKLSSFIFLGYYQVHTLSNQYPANAPNPYKRGQLLGDPQGGGSGGGASFLGCFSTVWTLWITNT